MSSGVYLHIPFCKSRCSYCDFATDVWRSGDAVERYVDALCKEITAFQIPIDKTDDLIDTIYFGGGTPSLLSAQQVERIIRAIDEVFLLDDAHEVTMEMNPATVSAETLAGYRELGVNRASFGVQTFNDRDLKLLARGHDANDARETFRLLREAGFTNVSFDLIAGLPGQTLDDWERNLGEALAMGPEHLSLYLLEVHQGTPLAEQLRSGRRPMPDEDTAAAMYEMLLNLTAAAGLQQYEISNFSRPGFESRHNTKYWRLDPVYGFGVSAHSFDGSQRYSNERDTGAFVKRIEEHSSAEVHREQIDAAAEYIFLGLRLTRGIDLAEYRERFGIDLRETDAEKLGRLIEAGLVTLAGSELRLTRKGMLFSNDVFVEFV